MIDNYKLALTTLGSDLMAKNLAGSTIEFTKFILGSGTYAGTESTAALAGMTALKTPKSTFGITKVEKQNGATCKITLAATNLNETAGFYISEIGIYAKGSDGKEILYAIIMLSPDQREWFPPYNSQVPASLDLNVFLSVGRVGICRPRSALHRRRTQPRQAARLAVYQKQQHHTVRRLPRQADLYRYSVRFRDIAGNRLAGSGACAHQTVRRRRPRV